MTYIAQLFKRPESIVDIVIAMYTKSMIDAKKSLGQHFLFNQVYLDKIMTCSLKDYADQDQLTTLFEIGAGLGTLTDKMSFYMQNQGLVITIEKDKELYAKLLTRWTNVKCILGDALQTDFKKLISLADKVGNSEQVTEKQNMLLQKDLPDSPNTCLNTVLIANLPYNISAHLIVKFITDGFAKRYCILVQKEMAERVCAKVGREHYGRLAVLTQAFCKAKMCFNIHGDIFKPKTKVMSSFLIIEPIYQNGQYKETCNFDKLDQLVKICFSQRRKMLSNVVPKEWQKHFIACNVNLQQRAEQVDVQIYIAIAKLI